jgi:hypothetical protein
MVVGIKPQAQPRDLYTVNLAQAFPFTRFRLSATGHERNICEHIMAGARQTELNAFSAAVALTASHR